MPDPLGIAISGLRRLQRRTAHIEADGRRVPSVVDIIIGRVVELPGGQLRAERLLRLPRRRQFAQAVKEGLLHWLKLQRFLQLACEGLRFLRPYWSAEFLE